MAGRQAFRAAMLAAAAAGSVIASTHAGAQTPSQPATLDQPTLSQPGTPPPPGPIARPSAAVGVNTAGQQQNLAPQPGTQQQGVAIPHSAASSPRRVNVLLSTNVIYDTNAARTNSQRASASGLSKDDIRIPLALNLDIFVPVGPNSFSLSGNVGYDFNVRNSQRNGEDIGLRAGYQRSIQPCSVTLGGLYQRNRTELGNSGFLIVPVKNIETRSGIDGAVSCGSLGGVSPFVSGAYSSGRNSETLRQVSDFNTISYGAGISAGQATHIEVGLIASIDDTEYPNRAAFGGLLASGFKAKSAGFYFNRAAARRLRARVQLNYTSVTSSGGGSGGQSASGLSGQADATFIPGGRFVFSASASRAVVPSLSANADLTVSTIVGLSVSAAVSPKTGVSAGINNRKRKYVASFYDPVHPLTDDVLRTIDVSANHRIGSKLNLDASVVYESRKANDPFFDFDGMRFAVGASISL